MALMQALLQPFFFFFFSPWLITVHGLQSMTVQKKRNGREASFVVFIKYIFFLMLGLCKFLQACFIQSIFRIV